MSSLTIGVDFDNTIIGYDQIMHVVAIEMGLIDSRTLPQKRIIRAAAWELPQGDIYWQRLQAEVYGPRIDGAILFDGVQNFFLECTKNNISIFIISHKTKYAGMDSNQVHNLRIAALDWMTKNGFFDPTGLGLTREQVFFESTRQNKIARIKKLKCTHFIDDLEEVFRDTSFPGDTQRILFQPYHQVDADGFPGIHMVSSWRMIFDYFFG